MADPVPVPLGGSDADYGVSRSRQSVINMIPEADKSGSYRTVKDCPGLTDFADLDDSPGRSDLFVNSGFMYCVAGASLFRVDKFGTVTNLGTVGGSGRAKIFSNSVPGDNQIMILNGAGTGFVYTNGAGLVQVTDGDFFASVSGDVLNEIGWFVRRGTNEIFGSDVSDLTSYPPARFTSAEEHPDDTVALVAKKSALWILGGESVEYWQTSTASVDVPIRAVRGASKERGIAAVDSLAEAGEMFAWFADDNTVRMIEGQQMVKISDLDFELKVRGDGTPEFPGFSVTDDAIGFFVDGPAHKIYYLTFPTQKFTWGYDFTTGLEHGRASGDQGQEFWRVVAASLFNNKLYGLDGTAGKIYELDQGAKTESGEIMRRVLVTPSMRNPYNWTLPAIELEMEVGQVTDPAADPKMRVEYTKDGGYTWTTWGDVSLGKFGGQDARVVMRHFGKIIRHKDFMLRFTITDDVRVQMYQLWATIEQDEV